MFTNPLIHHIIKHTRTRAHLPLHAAPVVLARGAPPAGEGHLPAPPVPRVERAADEEHLFWCRGLECPRCQWGWVWIYVLKIFQPNPTHLGVRPGGRGLRLQPAAEGGQVVKLLCFLG